jgi:hypothetical protein
MTLSGLDLATLAALAAGTPLMVAGFVRYGRRYRTATMPIERELARNGLLTGVGIACVFTLSLLNVARHVL